MFKIKYLYFLHYYFLHTPCLFFLVSFSFKKHQIITIVIKTGWLRSHNPYCGYLILVFENLEKFSFFSRCIKERVFDLFNIQNADRNFIFFISSRTLLFRMAKPSEFCKNELWRVTTDHNIKNKTKNRKVGNLGKWESKRVQKDFLVPIYKIFLSKILSFDEQWENLAKSFNFADMNFHRWPISRNL